MKVLGPSCLIIGSLILLTVSVYAVRYKCDHEPEEPNIAFLRLASEMSLNWDPERNKYALMRNLKPSSRSTRDLLKKIGTMHRDNSWDSDKWTRRKFRIEFKKSCQFWSLLFLPISGFGLSFSSLRLCCITRSRGPSPNFNFSWKNFKLCFV